MAARSSPVSHPVIQDRPAVEKDRVDAGQGIADALVRQRDAAIEPHDVERAVERHRPLGLAVGEFLDADQHLAQVAFEAPRQCGEGLTGERFEIGQRGRQLRHQPASPA